MIRSSLEGNITSFLGVEHSDKIGKLGSFPLANWITGEVFANYIQTNPLDSIHKIYIQVGTLEGGMPIDNIELNISVEETHGEYF